LWDITPSTQHSHKVVPCGISHPPHNTHTSWCLVGYHTIHTTLTQPGALWDITTSTQHSHKLGALWDITRSTQHSHNLLPCGISHPTKNSHTSWCLVGYHTLHTTLTQAGCILGYHTLHTTLTQPVALWNITPSAQHSHNLVPCVISHPPHNTHTI
jgi:hypothetical protein